MTIGSEAVYFFFFFLKYSQIYSLIYSVKKIIEFL